MDTLLQVIEHIVKVLQEEKSLCGKKEGGEADEKKI